MRQIILILLVHFAILNTTRAQSIDDVPLKEINAQYVQLRAEVIPFKNKISVNIDYGQSNAMVNIKSNLLKDESGKPMAFNSMIDALNFFMNHNYDLFEVYTLSTDVSSTPHYILRRKKEEL